MTVIHRTSKVKVEAFPRTALAISFLVVAATGQHAPAQSKAEQDLLTFVRSAHRDSREQIRTASCRVSYEISILKPDGKQTTTQKCSGQYWYSTDAIRLKADDDGQAIDYVWKDSVRDALAREDSNGSRRVSASRSAYSSRHLHRGDAWLRGLLALYPPETVSGVSFEKLVELSDSVRAVKHDAVDGNPTVLVRLGFSPKDGRAGPWDVEVHFDPSVNYLIRKIAHISTERSGGFRREEEVTAFKEVARGIFFPEKVIGRSGLGNGLLRQDSTAILSDVRINQRLSADTFRIRFPHGVYLTDTIRDEIYQVDADGRRISASSPLGKIPPPPAARGTDDPPPTPTTVEPKPFSRFLLPVSAVVLVAGLALLIVRRWKSQSTE